MAILSVILLLFFCMVLDQSLHGALHDGSQFHTEALGGLLELFGEGVGYGAYEVDG